MTTTTESKEVDTDVAQVLPDLIYPDDFFTTGTTTTFDSIIDSVYNTSYVEVDEQDVFDTDEYILQLEAILWTVLQQRDILFGALEASHSWTNSDEPSPLVKAIGVDVFKKMMIYCASGMDACRNNYNRKFYTEESFEAACAIAKLLPEEWKERAARFIEVYAANLFETEFKDQTL